MHTEAIQFLRISDLAAVLLSNRRPACRARGAVSFPLQTALPLVLRVGFHPSNYQNQKKVWIAQEKSKADARKEKERLQDYKAEQAMHDTKSYALMTRKESEMAVKRCVRRLRLDYAAHPASVLACALLLVLGCSPRQLL